MRVISRTTTRAITRSPFTASRTRLPTTQRNRSSFTRYDDAPRHRRRSARRLLRRRRGRSVAAPSAAGPGGAAARAQQRAGRTNCQTRRSSTSLAPRASPSSTKTAPRDRSCCPRRWAAASRSSITTTTADPICSSSTRGRGHGRPSQRTAARSRLVLYRNDGGGHFTDVTAAAGLAVDLYGMGVGRRRLRQRRLGRPLRHGRRRQSPVPQRRRPLHRRDRRERASAGRPDQWSTCATLFDYDNDGDLDLFVCNYVRWSPAIDLQQDFRVVGIGRAYGPPRTFEGHVPLPVPQRRRRTLHRRFGERRRAGCEPGDRRAAGQVARRRARRRRRRRLAGPRRRQRHGAELPVPQRGQRPRSRKSARARASPSTPTATAAARWASMGRLPQRRVARPRDRQLRQRDDRPLRIAAAATSVLRRGDRLRPRPDEPQRA